MLDGSEEMIAELLPNLPGTFLVRETDASLLPLLQKKFPEGRPFLEKRMDVRKSEVKELAFPDVRRLTPDDAASLASFHGAPTQALPRFEAWLNGAAAVMGAFVGDQLVATGSTSVSLPEVWGLVGIATHPSFRGRGYASQVTAALTKFALEKTDLVSLTVLSDNVPALRVYEKLGYQARQDRIWFDLGAGSSP